MLKFDSIGTIHKAFKLNLSGNLKKYYYNSKDHYFDYFETFKNIGFELLWNSDCTNFKGFKKDYTRTYFINTELPDGISEYFNQINSKALEKALSLWGQWLPRIGGLTDQTNVPPNIIMDMPNRGFILKSAKDYELSYFDVENKLLTYSTLQRYELLRFDDKESLLGVCYLVKKFYFIGGDNIQNHYHSGYIANKDGWALKKPSTIVTLDLSPFLNLFYILILV
ncbi:hypothetical protein [Allofrancisella frigidaquae]|uniref:Uncharacterized protein n=1 Tax=Allofrancisella frigidaquae TaxID=1085644 RepID=A0A6M3HUN7_9GAMM|nr:hypothetical protein [Allofrancisella frigidaquae]QIV94929.1 hypothetical protein E3E15_06025 [Allofrancisella frigidaquae]